MHAWTLVIPAIHLSFKDEQLTLTWLALGLNPNAVWDLSIYLYTKVKIWDHINRLLIVYQ